MAPDPRDFQSQVKNVRGFSVPIEPFWREMKFFDDIPWFSESREVSVKKITVMAIFHCFLDRKISLTGTAKKGEKSGKYLASSDFVGFLFFTDYLVKANKNEMMLGPLGSMVNCGGDLPPVNCSSNNVTASMSGLFLLILGYIAA